MDILKLLIPEVQTLLGRSKSKITKDKNGKKCSKIRKCAGFVVAYCNLVHNSYKSEASSLHICAEYTTF